MTRSQRLSLSVFVIVPVVVVGLAIHRDTRPKPPIHDSGWQQAVRGPHGVITFEPCDGPHWQGYDKPGTACEDGSGLCVHDAIREKVAPGSRDRELTAEEEKRFIAALEKVGMGTVIAKRKGGQP